MSRSRLLNRVPLALAAAGVAAAALSPAQLGQAAASTATDPISPRSVQDLVARQVAMSFSDPRWLSAVSTAVTEGVQDLEGLTIRSGASPALRTTVADGNAKILVAKGLPSTTGDLLTVRVADPSMLTALKAGAVPVVSAPADDDTAGDVTAYDRTGRERMLSRDSVPTVPVLMVDIDVDKALDKGIELVNAALNASGNLAPTSSAPGTAVADPCDTVGGVDVTRLNAVRVADDHDDWFKGDSEIYSIVGGISVDVVDGKNPAIASVVKMPYLNTEKKTYYPNQDIIWWHFFKFNSASFVMMEDDGDTNYSKLVSKLNQTLGALSKKYAVFAPLVDEIISAIPTSWWTDDPDHVEQWYMLQKRTEGRVNGASGNGWMEVEPVFVECN